MKRRAISWGAVGALLALLGIAAPETHADTHSPDEPGSEHDRAHRARARGEIRPLEEILPPVQALFPGEVARIELERENGIWIYEFKVIDRTGRLLEIEVDARSGRIIEVEGE